MGVLHTERGGRVLHARADRAAELQYLQFTQVGASQPGTGICAWRTGGEGALRRPGGGDFQTVGQTLFIPADGNVVGRNRGSSQIDFARFDTDRQSDIGR